MNREGTQAVQVNGKGVEARFQNNIFVGGNGAPVLAVEQPETRLRFENNFYWSGGTPFQIQWDGQSYTNLPDWRVATGQEVIAGKPAGLLADPRFASTSVEPARDPDDWKRRLALFTPQGVPAGWLFMSAPLLQTSASKPSIDILGHVLRASFWPPGAIQPGF